MASEGKSESGDALESDREVQERTRRGMIKSRNPRETDILHVPSSPPHYTIYRAGQTASNVKTVLLLRRQAQYQTFIKMLGVMSKCMHMQGSELLCNPQPLR